MANYTVERVLLDMDYTYSDLAKASGTAVRYGWRLCEDASTSYLSGQDARQCPNMYCKPRIALHLPLG